MFLFGFSIIRWVSINMRGSFETLIGVVAGGRSRDGYAHLLKMAKPFSDLENPQPRFSSRAQAQGGHKLRLAHRRTLLFGPSNGVRWSLLLHPRVGFRGLSSGTKEIRDFLCVTRSRGRRPFRKTSGAEPMLTLT